MILKTTSKRCKLSSIQVIYHVILDLKTSTTKLTNLISALNDKQNASDSLGLKNNTKLEILEVQTEKIDEDLERLKEKSMNKWKEIASKEVTFQSKEEFDALAQKVQGIL
jgi:phosphoenolpyruvate carboxylase